MLFWHQQSLPPKIPLWFSQPWGESRLSDPAFLWLLPLLIAFFLVVNNGWAKFLEKNHPQLALLLVWTSFLIAIVCFFPLYRIILAVI